MGTTLRSAIAYIHCLKQLIGDCDAGLVDQTEFAEKEDKISESNIIPVKTPGSAKKVKTPKKGTRTVKGKVKGSKPVILDAKWTNYGPQYFGHKFAIPKDINMVEKMPSEQIYQIDTSYQNITHHPLPDMTTFNVINPYGECYPSPTSSCASPRDVNEISLHISLLEPHIIEDNSLQQYIFI